MKILELCTYSAGICGVWNRVKEESIRLSKKGHQVKIFSSNFTKGNNEIAFEKDKIEDISILRFPAKKLGGESFMSWDFEKSALDFSPDVIIAHCYRHTHTTTALKIAKKLKKQGKSCKVLLVTHAPFARESTRTFIQNLIVGFYDFFIGKTTINKFDSILPISKWEIPYLIKLGVKKEKIKYIPNGIPEEFFKIKKTNKKENKILFLGRISPIKDIETPIKSLKFVKDSSLKFEIVGPVEEDYFNSLKELIKREKLENRVFFSKPIYNIQEKINKLDSARFFILSSKSEGMPQGLIEAMARGKIVFGSDIISIKDLIENKKNGYLFKQGDEKDLAKKINFCLSKTNLILEENIKQSVKQFNWENIIKSIETIISQ
jgi:glycosyltransferase involved in cell wall biosynthesis